MNTLSIKDVKKKYRIGRKDSGTELNVLDSISLRIRKGEFVGILGPNGCGKTTLFRIIAGVEKPDSGEVSVFGKSSAETRIGYVAQDSDSALYPWFTIAENLAFALPAHSGGAASMALEKLSEFGILQYASMYPYQLSGGLRQLAALARATFDANLFLFDEPLNGLSYQNRQMVEESILGLRNGKNTALLISHDIESAVLLCDKIVIFSEKPTTIRAVVPVNLQGSRDNRARFTQAFNLACKQIFEIARSDKTCSTNNTRHLQAAALAY